MSVRIGVVVFPGSNCDRDTLRGLELAGAEAVPLWHEQGSLDGVGIGNSVTVPAGVIRPILLPSNSVNHMFPSGPAAMP